MKKMTRPMWTVLFLFAPLFPNHHQAVINASAVRGVVDAKSMLAMPSPSVTFASPSVKVERNVSYTSGGHGFVENREGKPYYGINIPEDREGALAGLTKKTTNWSLPDAIAVHYFHHPAAEVETKMMVKVVPGQEVVFKLSVYDPQNLSKPLTTVDQIRVTGTGNEQEISLVNFKFLHSGYYRYCLECTQGCSDIQEISKFCHYSTSTEQTYKSGYLSSPSVHLSGWKSLQADKNATYDWCYQEVMMPKESDITGTYVMSMGIMGGYMGIQMNGYSGDGSPRHDVIFSIWDKGNTDNNPDLPDNLRAKLVDKNELATNERFGNEGTGMKSFMAGNLWNCDHFVQFLTNSRQEMATYVDKDGVKHTQENTLVTAWFNALDGKGWQYIATLRKPAQHMRFDSWYSFLENYDWHSGQLQRKGYYRNGYGCDEQGKWYHFTSVKADHTDGGLENGKEIVGNRYDFGFGPTDECVGPNGEKAFFMTTGGFSSAVENPADPGNYECSVPVNQNNTAVDTIKLDVLLKRVDQAVEHEKKAVAQGDFFEHNQLDKKNWKVVGFSSQETSGEGNNGRADLIVDGDDKTYWHSAWQSGSSDFPHYITVDMGMENTFQGVDILMSGGNNRHIKALQLLVSDNNEQWKEVYATNRASVQGEALRFFLDQPATGRYFKIVVNKSYSPNEHHVRINEVRLAGSYQNFNENKEKLAELTAKTKALVAACMQTDKIVSKENLQVTDQNASCYLSSNADQNTGHGSNDGGGIAALIDGKVETYFHSRWGGDVVNEPHFIQVDLGADMATKDFVFSYTTRKVPNPITANSPAPSQIKVQGSEDGNTFHDIQLLSAEKDGLPSYKVSGASWTSTHLMPNQPCRFLRFVVTQSDGPGNKQYNGQYFFGMSEFGLETFSTHIKDGLTEVTMEMVKQALAGATAAEEAYEKSKTIAEMEQAVLQLEEKYNRLETAQKRSELSAYVSSDEVIKEKIVGGTNPGFFTEASAEAYNAAYQGAVDLLAAAEGSASDYANSYSQLENALHNLRFIVPSAGKLYVLRSAHNDYAKDHLACVREDNKMYHEAQSVAGQVNGNEVWQFVPAEDGKFKVMSFHTGCGVKAFVSYNPSDLNAEAVPLSLASLNFSGQVKLIAGNNSVMHAQNEKDAVVHWDGGQNSPSAWYIQEVAPSQVGMNLNVSTKYGYAGFYSDYGVTLPEGLTAYIAKNVGANTVSLTSLKSNVVPARTGVIIEGKGGTYRLQYAENEATPVESRFLGCTYTQYLPGEVANSYYLFGAKNQEVGMYKAWLEYQADGTRIEGTDEGGHFKVPANKIYLPVINAGSQHLTFSFDDLTGVHDGIELQEEKVIYDLQGRRVLQIQNSGLYIVNGRKVYIK